MEKFWEYLKSVNIIELLIKSYAMTVCELGIIYNTKELIKLWRKR